MSTCLRKDDERPKEGSGGGVVSRLSRSRRSAAVARRVWVRGLVIAAAAVAALAFAPTSGPATAGLVAAFAFDEGSGTTVADQSGNGNNGTLANTTWAATGKYGKALSFNGTSSRVTVPNSASLQLTTGMTLEAWVNPTTVTNAWRDIIEKGNDNYYLMGTTDHSIRPGGGGIVGGSYGEAFGTAALAVNTWTHLAFTYDGSNLRLYVNGALVATQAKTGAITSSTSALTIGSDPFYGQYFSGMIDDLRIYNIALTQTQIQADMTTPVGPPAPDTIPPSAPGMLTATAVSATRVDLSWGAATDNTAVTGYHIERCQGTGCTTFTQIATTTTATTYSDTTTAAATSYSYRVRANDAVPNLGPYTNTASVTTPTPDTTPPSAPGTLSASAISATRVDLSWGAATDNTAVTGYHIERCQGTGCTTFTQIATTTTATTYSDTTTAAATSYSYRVRANDAVPNLGPYTNTATLTTPDTTPPSTPTGLVTSGVGQTTIMLSWSASTDNVGVTGYLVYLNGSQVGTSLSTSYLYLSGLACGTSYTLGVAAIDAASNVSGIATVTQQTSACPDTQPPSAPGTLTATAVSATRVDLSWGAATDNTAVTGYHIERCQGTGCTSFTEIATTTTATTYSDTTTAAATSYSYRVRANDAVPNLGPYTNTASVTTPAQTGPTPVAAYAFDEGAGASVTDLSGNGNNGTLANTSWATTGKYGRALSFNGTSSRVTVPNSASLQLSTRMTLEAWVNPTTISSAWRDVIEKGNDNYYLMATSSSSGRPVGGAIIGSSYGEAYGTASLTASTWAFLALTYDGTAVRLFVNGAQVSTVAKTGAITTSANALTIGSDPFYGQYFNGLIDNLRIYNSALTQTQIQTDMTTPVGSPSAPGAYSVGGTVSGLSGTVVLQNNGGDDLSVASNGPFTFSTLLAGGAAYSVTVKTSPAGQTCTASSASGTVASANVTNVAVACSGNSATPGADDFNRADGGLGANWTDISDGGLSISSQAVAGLSGGLAGDIRTGESYPGDQYSQLEVTSTQLSGGQWIGPAVRTQNGGQDTYLGIYFWNSGSPVLTLYKRSAGTWIQLGNSYNCGPLAAGTKLKLTAVGSRISFLQDGIERIAATDTSLTGGAPGIIAFGQAKADNWSGGTATSTGAYSVGGTVSGLSGTVVLQNNGGDDLSVASNGPFTFSTLLAGGAAYSVTVKTSPAGQTCTASSASGTVASANVTNVAVACSGNSATPGADDFNRADGGLGANWTDISDGGLSISSQAVAGLSGGLAGDIRTGESYPGDQYSQLEVTSTQLSGGQWIGPAVRTQNGGQDTYLGIYFWNSGSPVLTLYKRSAGTWIQLGNSYNCGPLAAGTKLKLTAVGSRISFLQDGIERIAATDTSLTGGAPGIIAFGQAKADNWSGGTATSTGAYSVGGTVSGLSGTVVLQNNGGDDLSVASNGPFTFSTLLASGAAYSVTVKTSPAGQTCTASSASGTVASANVTNVAVACSGNSATPGADDFNRADGGLGANWTDISDGGLSISSQAVTGLSGGLAGDIRTGESYPGDQYSQVEVTSTQLSGGQWIGPAVRAQNGGQDTYLGIYFWNSGSPVLSSVQAKRRHLDPAR